MSMKKKFAAALLCGLLLTGVTKPGAVYAASPSLSASADTGSAQEGEYVNINVDLGNNPSISTLGATLNYDSSVLKYDSSTWNSGFTGSDMQMASDTGSEVNLSVVCDDSYAADGTVVTVRFQAVKDTSSIPVTLSLRDMADADLSEVSDCTVASAVRAPEAQKQTEPKQTAEDDGAIDIEDPEEAADISVVDEESAPAEQPAATVSDTSAGGTKSAANVSSGMTQSVSNKGSSTQTAASPQAKSSRPDANYQTGIGFGSDALLLGAAAFGILALILAVRRHKEEV